MTVSAVLPTKDRPALLAETVRALLAQSVLPDELIIVDQSATDEGRRAVIALVDAAPPAARPSLVYVWDRTINGAAAARNAGLDRARGAIVVFCDDDVLPETDVVERLLAHYATEPDIAGLAPVIINYERPRWTSRLAHHVFRRGPFRDERQPVYWYWHRYHGGALVPVRMFTGALMSFRREALDGLRHDARYRAASVGEDIDLCWSLVARGGRLAIATDARIVHDKAPRPPRRPEEAVLTSWAFLYDKHVPKTPMMRLAFAWFIVGVVISALNAALWTRSWAPLSSLWAGLRGVRNDYAGSTFLAPRTASPSGPSAS
jgi:GT2 family glycosyltransferase